MVEKLLNITELARLCDRSRRRITLLVSKGQIEADFEDSAGHSYWTPTSARRIAAMLKEHGKTSKGRGRKVAIEGRHTPGEDQPKNTRLNSGEASLEPPESPPRHA